MKRTMLVLAAALAVALLLLAGASSYGAEATTVCPSTGDWVKVDGLTDKTYTYTAPTGKLVAETCYKHSTYIHYADVEPPASPVTITADSHLECHWWGCSWKQYDLSHASFRLVDVPFTPPDPQFETRYSVDCTGVLSSRYTRVWVGGRDGAWGEWTLVPDSGAMVHAWTLPYVLETYEQFSEPERCLEVEPETNKASLEVTNNCDGVSWFVKATEGGVYDAPAVHLWTDPYTTETVPGGSIVVTFSEGKPASITLTYGDQVEPTECLEEPPTCSMTKMYYQFTLTNGSETCYQVSWDTKDEIKRPNEFWIPNVTRQLCTCGWVAENAPYDGWVYKDCHGNYWYHGQRWDFFDKSLLTPHWDGQCAMGGC